MIQPSTIKLAKILGIPPEELVEKYKTDSLNLGQIAVIANFMDLSMEQTIKKFFPDFMYRRSEIRKEVANAKKQNRNETR